MKMKFSLFLLGILTLIGICRGLSLSRPERVAENFPLFESLLVTKLDQNGTGNDSKILKENSPETLKTLPRIIEEFIIPIENDDQNFMKTFITDVPKNVILLFIQESGPEGNKIWRDIKKSHMFPVGGYLQACERNFAKFPLEESMNGDLTSECDCQGFLQRNVENLFYWAYRAKVGLSNIETLEKVKRLHDKYGPFTSSIPLSLEREISILRRELFGESSDLRNDWHFVDLIKEKFSPVSTFRNDDELSDFFQPFQIIRIAFFKKWLNSLHKNDGKNEQLKANLLELLKDTIAKSKSLARDNGFILIAFTPGNELSSAINFLKETVSAKDTLLFVSGTCSQEGKGVPFFAHGPGSKYFYEANSVWDLPILVKRAASDCEGLWCKIGSLNGNGDLKKKHFKRTAKNEDSEMKVENSTTITKIIKVIDNTTAKALIKSEINNSTAGNASVTIATATEKPVVPLKNLELKNSTLGNDLVVNNSANVTNNKESMRNFTTNGVPSTTAKSTFENNLTDIGTTTIDNDLTNSRIISTVKDVKFVTVENSTTITKLIKVIDNTTAKALIKSEINNSTAGNASVTIATATEKPVVPLKNLNHTLNHTIGKNEDTETIAAYSEASYFSKQISTVIISVATSFAGLLLFQS